MNILWCALSGTGFIVVATVVQTIVREIGADQAKHNMWLINDMYNGHGLNYGAILRSYGDEPWRGQAKVGALVAWREIESRKQNDYLAANRLWHLLAWPPRVNVAGYVDALGVGDELEQRRD